ncbi:MAG: ThuA domain-containing protein [Paludisphaera borealis]|uniref:ThuA domain-containing protein n=1 Tax=Paludisphaera borealis TaxID=1387353 RepID=UPI00284BC075|nr:ThuA domain-containing protein [Paludisphaera borealis]MDR3620563.1 ThuA domain-containing protein [Paludisphaera borealis]
MHYAMLALLAAASLIPASVDEAPKAPVKVLLVTGVDHPAHEWKKSAPALRDVLEDGGRCAVRIVEDPEVLGTDVVFDYDVVVIHFRNDKPLARDRQARANLTKLADQGRGLVLIHFACGAFGGSADYEELAGMVWDGKNTHDPRGAFTVHVVDAGHPITAGLGDFTTDDELYIGLEERRPVHVLASARSKVTGRDHPMAFTVEHGPGRVFHSALGHDARALQVPAAAELIRRGTLWTAGRTP